MQFPSGLLDYTMTYTDAFTAVSQQFNAIVGAGLSADLLLFIVSCFVLIVSAELLVKSLTKIAFYFRLSDFVVGFMIVALATSVPELFVGVTSALSGHAELSLGNVIGSNIIDLTLVVGILALLRKGVRVETKAVRTDTLYMFLVSALPLVLMLTGKSLDKVDGYILLGAFFVYVVRLFYQQGKFRDEQYSLDVSQGEFIGSLAAAAVALVLLLVSAGYLVSASAGLSSDLLSPPILVGLFLISIGTTMPELIFGSGAILLRHKHMAFGDIIGSVVANNTLVLGLAVLLSDKPLEPNILIFMVSAFFMVVVAFLFTTFVEVEKHILWQEGLALILMYVIFVIIVLNIRMMEISYGIP